MNRNELKSQFTEDFLKEHWFDDEFSYIFIQMTRGLTPYQAIEYLCKSKKELSELLHKTVNNRINTTSIIVTNEMFNTLNTY